MFQKDPAIKQINLLSCSRKKNLQWYYEWKKKFNSRLILINIISGKDPPRISILFQLYCIAKTKKQNGTETETAQQPRLKERGKKSERRCTTKCERLVFFRGKGDRWRSMSSLLWRMIMTYMHKGKYGGNNLYIFWLFERKRGFLLDSEAVSMVGRSLKKKKKDIHFGAIFFGGIQVGIFFFSSWNICPYS